MLFYIGETFALSPDVIALAQNPACHVYAWKNPNTKAQPSTLSSYQLLTHPEVVLTFIKASLKDYKSIVITLGESVPELSEEMLKKRLYVEKERYIFMTPRAGFFFNQSLETKIVKSYSEIEELALFWKK